MTIINMLRGGVGNGDKQNIYQFQTFPRPDILAENMPVNKGWEYMADSFHYVERWNTCECFNEGAIEAAKAEDDSTDKCCLEVGDEIPLIFIPNRHTIEALTLTVNMGIEGVILGVKRYKVSKGDKMVAGATLVGTEMTAISGNPLPATIITQEDIDALGCNDRIDLDEFCKQCNGGGCHTEKWLTTPQLVGGCEYEVEYLSLVIEALPVDFDCAACCLDISLGARTRIPMLGA